MPNPLHHPVLSGQQSCYSSLSNALMNYDDPYSPVMRVYQREYAPGSKWHNTLRKMDPTKPSITFSPISDKSDIPGVRLSDLIRLRGTSSTIMAGGNDRVLASYDKDYINFRIIWEGYEIWCRSLTIRKDGNPISRADLATAIATNFQNFLSKYRSVPGQSPKWSLASGNFSTERLFLIRLKTTCEGCWQADIVVDFR